MIIKKRMTIYIEEKLAKLLILRSIRMKQSTSDYLTEVLYQDLLEEQEDLKDIEETLNEPTLSFDEVLDKLDLNDDK